MPERDLSAAQPAQAASDAVAMREGGDSRRRGRPSPIGDSGGGRHLCFFLFQF